MTIIKRNCLLVVISRCEVPIQEYLFSLVISKEQIHPEPDNSGLHYQFSTQNG